MDDEIKELAIKAGAQYFKHADYWMTTDLDIKYFAKLVAVAEREACAKAVYDSTDWAHEEQDMTLKETIAAAIRARGDV